MWQKATFFLLPPREIEQERGGSAPADSGGTGLGGGREWGEKGGEEEEVRFPYLARAGVERGGGATRADGGGRR